MHLTAPLLGLVLFVIFAAIVEVGELLVHLFSLLAEPLVLSRLVVHMIAVAVAAFLAVFVVSTFTFSVFFLMFFPLSVVPSAKLIKVAL